MQVVVAVDAFQTAEALGVHRVARLGAETPTVTMAAQAEAAVGADRLAQVRCAPGVHLDFLGVSRCDLSSHGDRVMQYRGEMCRPLAVQVQLPALAFSDRLVHRVPVHRWVLEADPSPLVLARPLRVLVERHRCHPRRLGHPPFHPRRLVRRRCRHRRQSEAQRGMQTRVLMPSRRVSLRLPRGVLRRDRRRFVERIRVDPLHRRRIDGECTAARG